MASKDVKFLGRYGRRVEAPHPGVLKRSRAMANLDDEPDGGEDDPSDYAAPPGSTADECEDVGGSAWHRLSFYLQLALAPVVHKAEEFTSRGDRVRSACANLYDEVVMLGHTLDRTVGQIVSRAEDVAAAGMMDLAESNRH